MRYRLVLVVAVLAVSTGVGAGQPQGPHDLLEAGRKLEVVDGDLEAAIRQYEAVLERYANDRRSAAEALSRIAAAHDKLGSSKARSIRQRLMREYADQPAAKAARARLGDGTDPALARQQVVWRGPHVDGFGSISPDGRLLTYVDWNVTGNLMLRDLVAGTNRPLTGKIKHNDPGYGGHSVISKSGKEVAFAWFNEHDRYELRVASLQTTTVPESGLLHDSPEVDAVSPYDWSADGRWIAAFVRRKDAAGQVALVSAKDGALRVLKSVDWRGPTKIFFSPDSRFIAYDLAEPETTTIRHIFVMAVDGSRETTAVAHPSQNTIMGWSPDGSQLLFASDRSGGTALWALPIAGGTPQGQPTLVRMDLPSTWSLGITTTGALYTWKGAAATYVEVARIDWIGGRLVQPAFPFQQFVESRGRPDWSPDGKSLAVVSCGSAGGGPCHITLHEMGTDRRRDLHPPLSYFAFLRWSPDGQLFLTAGTDLKGRRGIYTIDAQTGQTAYLGAGSWPIWSADGKRLYYEAQRGNQYALVERDLSSDKERDVYLSALRLLFMNLSPDGRYITATTLDSQSTVMLVPVHGGEASALWRVKQPDTITAMGWAPDGVLIVKELGAPGGKELWIVPVEAGEPRRLDIDVSAWSVPGHGLRVHPDGQHVAFAAEAGKASAEIVVLENLLPTASSRR